MDAIVYTSNSGFTAHYARLLGEQTSLPVYALDEAHDKVTCRSEVIYLGWLMAGGVKGYKKAAKQFCVRALCAVGMGAAGGQTVESLAKQNGTPADLPIFYLQGGFDLAKLHGIYKFMMQAMAKGVGKKLSEKPNRTAEEEDMLDMMLHGGDRVKEENLAHILSWLAERK